MAGRGPAPKEDRRRTNVPERGEIVEAAGIGWQHGAIPDAPEGLMPASESAWVTWFSAWFAAFWSPADLPGVRHMIRLQMALHRPAEFNRSHIPAFMADEEARDYVCVYPFVRSYDWYLLEDAERRDLLREHGQMARDYPDVRANTIASFALNDYEWILAFEADELHRIVDLMRELRASRARMHVREEVPFYTGPRVDVRTLVTRQR